ncbi:MAG: FkbM family methyltransferase [Candidatus Ochrobactrum gambitense]|nr:MAG: FkbM family methyltransferase [Candidatus Ochrobactrum gambitense]WEK16769.1 MAG: FkbM family methyltransferase [Candidatus Ochrobactrum gambitense]
MRIDKGIISKSGKRIYFDPSDKRGEQLAGSNGTLAPHSLALWNIALKLYPWGHVIDVGCNYGEMLVSADLPAQAEIVAFEPNPRILPYLRKTLSESGTPVRLIEQAVADTVKESTVFVVDEDWSGTSGLPKETDETVFGHNHKHSDISVPVTTLDHEFLESQPANICIKIDVEGHEFSVLAGAKKLLEQTPNWAVVLEILHMRHTEIAELAKTYPL